MVWRPWHVSGIILLYVFGNPLLEPDNAPNATRPGTVEGSAAIIYTANTRIPLCLLAASLRDRQVCYNPGGLPPTRRINDDFESMKKRERTGKSPNRSRCSGSPLLGRPDF